MNKVILSVIDDNGDTWLYPFAREDDADDVRAELVKFEEDGFYLNVEVIPVEDVPTPSGTLVYGCKEKTKTEIVLEWKEMLGVE